MATPSDILNAQQNNEEPGLLRSLFEAWVDRNNRFRQERKEMQDAEFLKAYEDLKRRNTEYTTIKRSKAIELMEDRLRRNGLIK